MSLLAELKRRNVLRMAGLYLVGAWLLVQVAGTVLPMFDVPAWVARAIVILLALGLVPALVFAWLYEMTPQGIKRDADVTPSQSTATQTGRRMDRLIVAGLVALVALLVVDRYRPGAMRAAPQTAPQTVSETRPRPAEAPSATAALPETVSDTVSDPNSQVAQKSIAVLAFTDLSPAKDQEYFSDGIAEEILNALVKVKGLKVAGRTSAFSYKGKDADLRRIGETLGVAHVLEGSVRKQGEKVRITAQLVKADDGFHLWSETYDGDLADVFELQEQIARKITEELKLVLQGDQQQRLVPVATANPEAYAKYLQASAIFNRRERVKFPHAIALLDEAIRLDPAFARAHARLAALHVLSSQYTGADLDASIAAARQHARRAIELMSAVAEPHTVLAYSHGLRRDFIAEREGYDRALALEPDDVLSNFWLGLWYLRSGYLAESARLLDRLLEIDPMLPNGLHLRGWLYEFEGDTVNARRLTERALDLGIANANLPLAFVEHRGGNDAKAIAALEAGYTAFGAGLPAETPRIVAEGAFGNEAARRRAVEHVESLLASRAGVTPGPLPYALMILGEPARALAVIQSGPTSSSIWEVSLWHPRGQAARRLPQFAEFARQVGFAAVWDKYGPPDGCRRTAGGDYVCD